ncbi:RNA-BINDING PROTEIN [Salix viminalis]|uniref:RNA-BINDING PROTEIN n=1 Tax=Salix viminalis TaxID=40686 RepID=A0A9Q0SPF3_SALVM|nr:RNA-BINDING PROTEIN [Salix viminalis]
MYHCNGWTFTWGVAARGGTNVCLRSTTAKDVYHNIAEHSVTHMCCAPIVFNILLEAKPHERREITSPVEILTGGAPPPPSLLQNIERLGFHVNMCVGSHIGSFDMLLTLCAMSHEPDDSTPADIALSNPPSLGKKGFEAGWRQVYSCFKRFTFIHFHSVKDATKALDATNGTSLEKNGQILRVAYAKSILGPGTSGPSQSSSLAAAAIEAAAFSLQYDAVGWAPKEYNPDDNQSTGGQEQASGEITVQKDGSAPQSGFVWDEASGYYYDAASASTLMEIQLYRERGGNNFPVWNLEITFMVNYCLSGHFSLVGLYYDGNQGVWYSYDQQTQQYIPFTDNNDNKASSYQSVNSKSSDGSSNRKVVISAPAATITSSEKAASLPDAVQAAASAALAAEKKEKEKAKEIKLASKSSILANKKKMNNVLTMWKQRSHEGQTTRLALDDSHPSAPADDRLLSVGQSTKSKFKSDTTTTMESSMLSSVDVTTPSAQTNGLESLAKPRPVSNSSGGDFDGGGVIRGSGRGVLKSDTSYSGPSAGVSISNAAVPLTMAGSSTNADTSSVATLRTDVSALGSYTPPEQPQNSYRDRAAERRSLYGSSSVGDDLPDADLHLSFPQTFSVIRVNGFPYRGFCIQKECFGSNAFPPGVGGGRVIGDAQSYRGDYSRQGTWREQSRQSNASNMGWQEGSVSSPSLALIVFECAHLWCTVHSYADYPFEMGPWLGLGKDGSGMIEPVQAEAIDRRDRDLGASRRSWILV